MKSLISLTLLLGLSLSLMAQCPNYSQNGRHVIQRGETFYGIAKQYNITMEQLANWNNSLSVYAILRPCDELVVQRPGTVPAEYNYNAPETFTDRGGATNYSNYRRQMGNRHTVQPGETMAGLADLYGYTEKRFREINPMGSTEEVTPGSVILSTDCACDRISYDNGSGLGYNDNTAGSGWSDWRPVGGSTPTTSTTTSTGTRPTNTPGAGSGTNPSTNPNSPSTNPGTATPPPSTAGSAAFMRAEERSMVDEINLMRSNPRGYIKYVQEYVAQERANNGFPISQFMVDELVAELNNLGPLSILEANECIYNIARTHGEEQKPLGDVNHFGRDGKGPYTRITNACSFLSDGNENLVAGPESVRESIIILLIDEGIPTRGHRKTLLNPAWKYVGCYLIGTVGGFPNYWVQNFGG